MTGLEQILSSYRQLQPLGKVPSESGIRRVISIHAQCRQCTHITVRRIELKSFGQMEQNLRRCLIVRTGSLVGRDT